MADPDMADPDMADPDMAGPFVPQAEQEPEQPLKQPPKWHFWKKQKKPPHDDSKPAPLPYVKLFKYTDTRTRVMIVLALVFAAIHGFGLPLLTLLFGRIIDEFSAIFEDPNAVTDIASTVAGTTRLFLIISFVIWVVSFFQLYFALSAANIIGNDLRSRFFTSLIRQHPAFFDDAKATELATIIATDIGLIQGGVGDKLATATQYVSTFVAGIIVGFIKGWQLSLVVLAVTPLLLVSGMAFGNASAEATGDGLGSYAEAGGIAFETISLIRSVTSYSGQKTEKKRYDDAVGRAYVASAKSAIMSGLGLGVAMCLILATYALAFWFGSTRIREGVMTAGDVLLTFFALSLGANSLGTAGPAFKSFSKAQAAAPRIFNIIDAESKIDPLDNEAGVIPDGEVKGHISFRNCDFSYDKVTADGGDPPLVLSKLNLEIEPGSSEALVGKSGCGKSTVARLIQRFYDPVGGGVFLDGRDLRELNVRWLRSQIGVVAQMPSLFKLTIRENIALGAGFNFSRDAKTGETTVTRHEPTEEEIIEAAKMANAHDFIKRLPEGYDSLLGERGAMLSGGQKQRICIARALVRNPKILVLDESTASLDTASERIVQEALERASSGRTTVTIAHRLSTVRNCDSITCIQDGNVLERGNHDTLMNLDDGFYRTMFEMQTVERKKLQEEKALKTDEEEAEDEGPAAIAPLQQSTTTKTVGDSVTKAVDGPAAEAEKEKGKLTKGIFLRTLRMNSPEWVFILFGVIGAALSGVVWPLASIPLVNMIEVLANDVQSSDVTKWSVAFVLLALLALVGNFLQHGVLGVSGERLTRRVRSQTFEKLLRQEMGYFDMEENSLGAVTSMLSADVSALKGLTGDILGVGINVVASLGAAIIIAFIGSWQIALVVLAIIPGVALGGYFEMQASAGIDSGARKEFSKANMIAAEAIDNVATVRSLCVEEVFLTRFEDIVATTKAGKVRKDLITAFAFGFSEFCQFLIWYATFKAGGDFLQDGQIEFKDMLQASLGLLFGAITLGNVSVFAPDVAGSSLAAANVFSLLDRKSQIDPFSEDGEALESAQGNVAAKDVYFEYPRRPDVRVLRGLSLDIESGKTLAIVGTSGHGKSTIIGLLQRFYAIRKGAISVDGRDIAGLKVRDVRWQMGLVQQEPELFDRSVFDNIAYGLSHEEGATVTRAQVEEAARLANAHEFIQELPEGYDTGVGPRGERLSGGQRQRVAIARSLVRQPKILLLDEATSALDSASERAVQQALDQAGRGRTTIVVAHRLSTIKNADKIVVVRRGRIVESGTHSGLLRKNGEYARLIENQLTEV